MSAGTKTGQYLVHYGAQLPVICRAGQETLRRAHLHISGVGRIGSAVALAMAAAGVGSISANDPQNMEPENLGAFAPSCREDLGARKVAVLERVFISRDNFIFHPLAYGTESPSIDAYIRRSDLVISCANTLKARLAAERKAIRYRKPILQVAAFDGLQRLGGLITLRLPRNRWSACFGCLADRHEKERGEGLLSTVTWTLAGIASNMVVQILTSQRSRFITEHNVFFIDLEKYCIEALAVKQCKGCKVCGRRSNNSRER